MRNSFGFVILLSFVFACLLGVSAPTAKPGSFRPGSAALRVPVYVITDIAATTSGFGNAAPAINNGGQIAGLLQTSSCMHAFRHTGDILADLSMLPGGTPCSYATAINNYGDLALNKDLGRFSGDYTGFQYLSRESRLAQLVPLPTDYQVALVYGINDKSYVVGEAVITPPATKTEAFLYERDDFSRLGTLGGERASALDINNSEVIVGWSQTKTVPSSKDPGSNQWFIRPGHAFVYTSSSGMKDLNSLISAKSELELRKANAISDQAHIVGFAYNLKTKTIRAFLMIHNSASDLGTFLPNGGSSYALAVNNRGEAVGAAYLDASGAGNFRAALFKDGRVYRLDEMIDKPGWVLNEATGINDKGQIVGWGTHDGKYRVFLLTPM